jgi:hypothetical protein
LAVASRFFVGFYSAPGLWASIKLIILESIHDKYIVSGEAIQRPSTPYGTAFFVDQTPRMGKRWHSFLQKIKPIPSLLFFAP